MTMKIYWNGLAIGGVASPGWPQPSSHRGKDAALRSSGLGFAPGLSEADIAAARSIWRRPTNELQDSDAGNLSFDQSSLVWMPLTDSISRTH
jgi:hypothetical protein